LDYSLTGKNPILRNPHSKERGIHLLSVAQPVNEMPWPRRNEPRVWQCPRIEQSESYSNLKLASDGFTHMFIDF
jgi:hypothetical protein